jgi:hypothetical protein
VHLACIENAINLFTNFEGKFSWKVIIRKTEEIWKDDIKMYRRKSSSEFGSAWDWVRILRSSGLWDL